MRRGIKRGQRQGGEGGWVYDPGRMNARAGTLAYSGVGPARVFIIRHVDEVCYSLPDEVADLYTCPMCRGCRV